jgi:phosphatidylserine/phosphatidylglycerophosphate/cardiolipin synthase-like enzyme
MRIRVTLFVIAVLMCIGLLGASHGRDLLLAAPAATGKATAVRATIAKATVAPAPTTISWVHVYFTDPSSAAYAKNAVDQYVVPVLDAAQRTIDITSFDFNLPSVVNALIRAKKRGVTVRLVLDEVNGSQVLKASDTPDKQEFNALDALKTAGIPVVDGGRSNGLMHNKMIIVDSTILFMGSWNMSYNDTYKNNNNLLKITSQRLIANYQAKFNELFTDKKFGTKADVGAQNPMLTLDGVPVENYFSPVDKVMKKLVAEIKNAKKSIKFMAFTYTHADLSAAMIERAKAGVKVSGVIENRGASNGALVPLFCAKLPVETDGNPQTMHHKVIIIDDQTVITGSFNFTQTADNANDDNVLIIRSPIIAAMYNAEFTKVYGQGKTPTNVVCTK